jgi:transcription termination factor Rho
MAAKKTTRRTTRKSTRMTKRSLPRRTSRASKSKSAPQPSAPPSATPSSEAKSAPSAAPLPPFPGNAQPLRPNSPFPVVSRHHKSYSPKSSHSQPPDTPAKPVPNPSGFDGIVDNRLIPDAGLPTELITGVLDVQRTGHGYLRPQYTPSEKDVYVSSSQVRRFGLRPGDMTTGQARQPKPNEKYWGLLKVESINSTSADEVGQRPNFDDLTSIFPDQQIKLATGAEPLSTRIIDLISPIGKGQRALIVSPPKAGKTWLLKDIASGVAANYPDMHLLAVLIGERPEEVTDLKSHIKGEVAASNFDHPPADQVHIAELALERARRLVEMGKDVFVLLDSITRFARALNLVTPTSGRGSLSGGFDPKALFPAKRFFGAARNIKDGGSLTIIGTCLVDTGSRMDDLIYEEFKGTGNMELHLDRKLADRRVFPAFDIQKSGTRQEELLYDKSIYDQIITLRRMIDLLGREERTQVLIEKLKKTKTNEEFLEKLTQGS